MLQTLAKSLSYAFRGLSKVAAEEVNFRIQLALAVLVAFLAWVFGMTGLEKAILTLAITLVLVLELLNSALERVVDILKPRIHHYVEEIKDIAAAAVLVAALNAIVVGACVFWPYVSRVVSAS